MSSLVKTGNLLSPGKRESEVASLTKRGAIYLTVRYGLSILVGLGNMFVMTWWIGPHAYGVYVTAVGLTAFLASLTRFGVDTYLVRCDPAPDQRQYNIAFSLVLSISLGLLAVGIAIVPLLERWYSGSEFKAPYLVLLMSIPVIGLSGLPTAKLERELNFRAVAGIELAGQLSAFVTAVVLAWLGFGVWAPVTGLLVWQVVALVAASSVARFRPRLQMDKAQAWRMLAFGLGFSASVRTWQLRTLVNPLLVGRFAGAEGVAYVAFAMRVAEGLSFVRTAAGRLAIAALARLQHDRDRFRAALEQALGLQVLTLGPLLCAFAWFGPWLVPRLMGERWVAALAVYPFVAAGVLVNSVFNLQASALFVVGRQWAVMRAYASHVALLVVAAFALLPRLGIAGYGWAELLACVGYVFILSSLSTISNISYRKLLPWIVVFLGGMSVPTLSHLRKSSVWLLLLTIAAILAWGWTRISRRAGDSKADGRHDAVPAAMRRALSFLMKARQRRWRYVRGVLEYRLRSAAYELRLAARRAQGFLRAKETLTLVTSAQASDKARSGDRHPTSAVFHFSASKIPHIVASVPEPLKRAAVTEADQLLQHRFCFRGRPHTFPERVNWNECPDGGVSWNWDLNRHAFLLKLATAYFYSGNRDYVTELLDLWQNWMATNPAGQGRNWKYPFEVAARLQNWIWAYFFLECSGIARDRTLALLANAMHEHADYLDSHLEYHWPNNHILLEAKALYEFALLFPQLDKGQKYLRRAGRVLEHEVVAQVLPSGAHVELCSMYHRIVAGELGELVLLCHRQGKPLPDLVEQRAARMVEFSRALLRQDGSAPLLGDSAAEDTHIRFDFARRQYSDLHYWLWPEVQQTLACPKSAVTPEMQVFPDAGYAFLRSTHGSSEIHLTFDFGTFSRCVSANHGHSDALSFELYADGHPLVVDPGIYLPSNDGTAWKRHFRSAGAHNTLTVDGKDWTELSDYCDIRRSARTRLLQQRAGNGDVSVTAECVPYWVRAGEVRHIRKVCLRQDRAVIVSDQVAGAGRHSLSWSFQFAPEVEVALGESAQVTGCRSGQNTRLFSMAPSARKTPHLELFRGKMDPPRGWVSRNSAEILPAYAAVYSIETELPFEIEFMFSLPA